MNKAEWIFTIILSLILGFLAVSLIVFFVAWWLDLLGW